MSGYTLFNRQRFSQYLCCVCCALMMILTTGCGDDNSDPEKTEQVTTGSTATGSAVLSIQWHRASTDSYSTSAPVRQAIEDCAGIGVASITCEVYDANNTPLASGGPWSCEDGEGRIDGIPVGADRTFAVLGWDTEGGNIVYQGRTTSGIDINLGEIADVGEIMTYPFVPTGLAATPSSSGGINLAWNDFIEEFEVAGYRIYRDGTAIATSDASSYEDGNLSADTRYCYTVAAYDVFGNESGPSNETCATPNTPSDDDVDDDADGYSEIQGDCDDADANVNPGAAEVCNGVDDNCADGIDEGLSTDADEDGHYTPDSCFTPADDCDDADASVHPGATETCNGVDDNCDGSIDEDVLNTYYRDSDGDHYGDAGRTTQACSAPDGYVADGTDCDDADASVHPGATEACNGVDDNCDGSIDEGCTCAYSVTIGDNDGYGYGAFVVPDNEDLPLSDEGDWIFENREPSERAATDGSQHTDFEPEQRRDFTFTITFCPADPQTFSGATFTLDVSGIQASAFGASTLLLDGRDYSEYVNLAQGAYGSQVIRIHFYYYDVELFTDGRLTVDFQGGATDHLALDYFSLDTNN